MGSEDRRATGVVWSPRLGQRLEASRVLAGLRRLDLANRLGVREGSVLLWERGAAQPSEEHLARLTLMLAIETSAWSVRSGPGGDEAPARARGLQDERSARSLEAIGP